MQKIMSGKNEIQNISPQKRYKRITSFGAHLLFPSVTLEGLDGSLVVV